MAPAKNATTVKKSVRSSLTPEHKAALAVGREQGRVVRHYLEALERNRPKRGRKRTVESIKRQLAAVEARLELADPLSRLHLVQERRDLEAELARKDGTEDIGSLEEEFVKVAGEYGRRKGITYASWREAGVSPSILRQAGVSRSSRG
ncbi:MAG: hypothetical protein ACRDYD_12350 [Acidimicrobiales bacterium]